MFQGTPWNVWILLYNFRQRLGMTWHSRALYPVYPVVCLSSLETPPRFAELRFVMMTNSLPNRHPLVTTYTTGQSVGQDSDEWDFNQTWVLSYDHIKSCTFTPCLCANAPLSLHTFLMPTHPQTAFPWSSYPITWGISSKQSIFPTKGACHQTRILDEKSLSKS